MTRTGSASLQALPLAAALLALACAPVAHYLAHDERSTGISPARLERLVDHFERVVEHGELAGAVLLVARDGLVQLLEPIGRADLASGRAMEIDTIFQIASMTKPVTSVGALLLLEEGKLLLDDPVSRWLPELADLRVAVEAADGALRTRPAQREMTVRDLLRHTSGLASSWMGDSAIHRLYEQRGVGRGERTLAELVTRLSELPLAHEPGTRWEYGVSTDVLGRLIEVVSGQPLDVYLRERIFEPLGMHDTGFGVPPDALERVATVYTAAPWRRAARRTGRSPTSPEAAGCTRPLRTTCASRRCSSTEGWPETGACSAARRSS